MSCFSVVVIVSIVVNSAYARNIGCKDNEKIDCVCDYAYIFNYFLVFFELNRRKWALDFVFRSGLEHSEEGERRRRGLADEMDWIVFSHDDGGIVRKISHDDGVMVRNFSHDDFFYARAVDKSTSERI